jgi:hypothetical protein
VHPARGGRGDGQAVAAQVVEQDEEGGAVEAGDQRAVELLDQAGGEQAQELVAGGVAERVVHGAEVGDHDVQGAHRRRRVGPRGEGA